ncbi:hypothetical protein ACULNC_26865 [Shigella flexneri]
MARCTVARLMAVMGLAGVLRVKGPYDHQPESRCRRRPRKPSVRGRTT